MNEQTNKEILERFNAQIPNLRYVSNILPAAGEVVYLVCRIPAGAAMYRAYRHPTIKGQPWYILKNGKLVEVTNEIPDHWFPISNC